MRDQFTLYDSDFNEALAVKLKWLRKCRGFMQKDVAAGVGVSVITIQNHEKGMCAVSLYTAVSYARFYGIGVEQLVPPMIARIAQHA